MQAAAHNPEFAAKVGIPARVAQEFNDADRARRTAAVLREHAKPKGQS